MSSFFFKGDNPFASNIDVKRLARKVKKWAAENCSEPTSKKDYNLEDALELVAKWLGAKSHHDLLEQAKDPNVIGLDNGAIASLVQRRAVSRGAQFPKKGLPSKFNLEWQNEAVQLYERACKARAQGKLEFVALVGKPNSGKTLLANHLCASRGGLVMDTQLAAFSHHCDLSETDSMIVYDRPASPVRLNNKAPGPDLFFSLYRRENVTLKMHCDALRLSSLSRTRDDEIPYDKYGDILTLRSWVQDQSQVTFVVSFPSLEAVEIALRKSMRHIIGPSLTRRAALNWRRVHVVNLDTMEYVAIDGPGYLMEKGLYKDDLELAR